MYRKLQPDKSLRSTSVGSSLRKFLLDTCCALHGTLGFGDARSLLHKTNIPGATSLSLVFTSAAGKACNSSPPPNLQLLYTYCSVVDWPSLGQIEDANFIHLPPDSTLSGIAFILGTAPTAYPVLRAIVISILEALAPQANKDPQLVHFVELFHICPDLKPATRDALDCATLCWRRHPVYPFLWLAIYLADASDAAARLLLSSGLVRRLRGLHIANFRDPRVSFENKPLQRVGQSRYDLLRLSYMLLRVLSRRVRTFAADDDGLEHLNELRNALREDIQCWWRRVAG